MKDLIICTYVVSWALIVSAGILNSIKEGAFAYLIIAAMVNFVAFLKGLHHD